MVVECPNCSSSDLDLVEDLDDGRKRVRCNSCHHEWIRGEAKRVFKTTATFEDLRKRFPSPDDIAPDVVRLVADLKAAYLLEHPTADARALEFRDRYGRMFSQSALPTASPDDLKYFANANLAGNPGNMSVFNTAWNDMPDGEAAQRVRESIDYLLYGPSDTYLEDRLTDLIHGHRGLGMIGFREALLTKVLCMVEPSRFLPINKYTGQAGKKEIALWVYGLRLPDPGAVSWTIGRLIVWSNDLLYEATGSGFGNTEHMAGFLWWAKDEMRRQSGMQPAGDQMMESDLILFKDDDGGFREWLRDRPSGFYLNAARSPSSDQILLHRVGCWHVGDAPAGETAWTTDYIKVCAMNPLDLNDWARLEAGDDARACQTCSPI